MTQRHSPRHFLPLAAAIILVAGIWLGYSLGGGGKATPEQRKFAKVLDLVSNNYVDELDIDSVLESAIPLLMQNLDPHSVYISAAELQEANQKLDGYFSGIGIQYHLLTDTD